HVVDACGADHRIAAGRADRSIGGGARVRASAAHAGWARAIGAARCAARANIGGGAAGITLLARIQVAVAADELVGGCAQQPFLLERDGSRSNLVSAHGVGYLRGRGAAHRVTEKMSRRRTAGPA